MCPCNHKLSWEGEGQEGQRHYQLVLTKKWHFPAINKNQSIRRINFSYGGSKFCNSGNSIKAHQKRAKIPLELENTLQAPTKKSKFEENETADLHLPHDDALVKRLDIGGCNLSWIIIDTGSSADILFYEAFKRMRFTKVLLKKE